MKVIVTTRHLKNAKDSEKIKSYALKKTSRIQRYVKAEKDPSELRVILSSEKFRDTAEISISCGNIKAISTVEANDMYSAIDNAVDTIVKQLKKQTEKKTKEKRRTGAKTKEDVIETIPSLEIENEYLSDMKIHKLPFKPMSIEEASLQLKVSEANFVAFKNSESGLMNVIYISPRGHKILIEP
ncbi:MAG: ribosome hibernation-promoting factor, HPF/YfiA family [Candidatus Dadabacteria bacterium]|jgi:putative sigma-54 modulation protein